MSDDHALYCVLIDGYADWEPALALATARQYGVRVQTVGFTTGQVQSAAGLRVQPDVVLAQVAPERSRLWVMAGGDGWAEGKYPVAEVHAKLQQLRRAHVPVAAICGATVACARAGLFAEHRHTSNDRQWLDMVVPNYAGASLYETELCVRDRGLITAAGTASTEFAREILAELGIMSDERRDAWFALFKTGRLPAEVDAKAFFASN
jgi:putative intracellular protease/amidase